MSGNLGMDIWNLAIDLGFTVIPTDGLSDGGVRYTDDEMIRMAFDYIRPRISGEEVTGLLDDLLARKE